MIVPIRNEPIPRVKMGKNNRDNRDNEGGSKRSKEVERALSKATLKFNVTKPNATQITAKFTDAMGTEVKEYINIYDEGDDNALLITLTKRIFKLGQTYELFGANSKGLAQVLARSLRNEEASQACTKKCKVEPIGLKRMAKRTGSSKCYRA